MDDHLLQDRLNGLNYCINLILIGVLRILMLHLMYVLLDLIQLIKLTITEIEHLVTNPRIPTARLPTVIF